MELFAEIKLETDEVHRKIMQGAWAKRLFAADYTLDEYLTLLRNFYCFYLPVETYLRPQLPTETLKSRCEKHTLLRDDLLFLNSLPLREERVCHRLPLVTNLPSALGVCYVLEGSTLGGQIITNQLKKSLSLGTKRGLSFFECYGPDTGPMWEDFKRQSSQIVTTDREREAMVNAAVQTFEVFSDWMEAA